MADGDVIASKPRSFFVHLLGGGWPDPDEVVKILHRRADATGLA